MSLPATPRDFPRAFAAAWATRRGAAGWQAVAAQNTDIVPGAETHLNLSGLRAVDYR
ncbi:hypothetical protein [Roseivivax sp. CAU 1753]